MKHLIIGAGATLAEAISLGVPTEDRLPVMTNFAKKTWENYSPHPLLQRFLRDLGYRDLGLDPRELFFRLEEERVTNIEHFLDYCWNHRDVELPELQGVGDEPVVPGFIFGLTPVQPNVTSPVAPSGEDFWRNFVLWGIGGPLTELMIRSFHENQKGWKDLALTKSMASRLTNDDLVLNLNYDTVFELALSQSGRRVTYSACLPNEDALTICKPHGSLNMFVADDCFGFGPPDWFGLPQPPGVNSFMGLIAPRMNKSFSQHRASQMMIDSVRNRRPSEVIFWGIGLTESDADLLDLYRDWSRTADLVVVINPDAEVAEKARTLLNCSIQHFRFATDWLADSD